ncbi:DUF3168 domain-containing protein [Erythrobacteraceae bacterium CFH 75059]|uniref:tail completion protein gp17 n=1 Tax=Qipengyuania thermophila TaxID=2509361 RepID=UPI0010210634|nr:DUF3168 domain-containing protein [Qipengyuania thermophila]TCD04275.1 DUF3168 domain-containing protein [Erythrobacteraceae bacterium CFH 75059]
MSGVDVIGALLADDPAVTALVPPANIRAGRLPDNATLPSLLVRSVSLVERQPLKRQGIVRITERVAVMARANNYRQQREIIAAVRDACAGQTGNIGGTTNTVVLSAGTGPDLTGITTFEQTQDFRVSFDHHL